MRAAAQQTPPAPTIEIHGVVTEAGTNLPVADAEITVDSLAKHPADMPDVPRIAKVTTDLQGAFRVLLESTGNYLVRASKEGYTDDGRNPIRREISNTANITLDRDHPSYTARFQLARTGELRGRVIDDETGKPIANFRVYPIDLLYFNGQPSQMGGLSAVTDSEGLFVFKGMRPGNYLAQIGAQTLKGDFLDKFTDEEVQKVDQDYRDSYWPGGGGLDAVLPVQLLPGGVADVGTIKARKVPYYRIHRAFPRAVAPREKRCSSPAGRGTSLGARQRAGKECAVRTICCVTTRRARTSLI
jgi:hypothetical protein